MVLQKRILYLYIYLYFICNKYCFKKYIKMKFQKLIKYDFNIQFTKKSMFEII